MAVQFMPVSHGVRSHMEVCQRVAWFVFECLEREHLITMKALAATVAETSLGWMAAWQPLGPFAPVCARPPKARARPTG